MISLLEALEVTRSNDRWGNPAKFDISFISYNKKTGEGGELIELKNCIRIGQRHNTKEHDTIGVKQLKSDNHPYAIHVRLITKFNDHKVFY
jgi:hypothetical protein